MTIESIGISLTIAAVIISIYNTVLFLRQSKLQEKQTLLQRSQIYPFVKINKVEYKSNVISISLENMTETSPACQLGLLVKFVPCSGIEGDYWKFAESIIFPDFASKKGYPTASVVPLKDKKGSDRLYGKKSVIFNVEPLFIFKESKKRSIIEKENKRWKYDAFIDLKRRLLGQGIRFVAVMFAVVYKDAAETLNEFEQLDDFIIDLNKHNNLQEANKDAIPFTQKTIGLSEFPAIDFEMYKKLKSYRSRLEPFDS